MHALTLAFVFPGYLGPLAPHHSDFYLPAAFAHGTVGLAGYARWPRPVGMMLFDVIGYLGIRGSIAFTVAVTLLNCAATAALVRRVLGDALDLRFLGAFVVYLFLLFAQPYFYTYYRHDALSQYSYALLLPAAWFALRHASAPRARDLAGVAAFALLAFLCKETYAPVALALAALHAVVAWKRVGARAALAPLVTIAAMFAVAVAVLVLRGFPLTEQTGSAYQVVLDPARFAGEWLRYAGEALNPLSAAAVALAALGCGLFAGRRSARFGLAVALPLAALLGWAGNAGLPNHHYPGYSWNGAYLMFAPVLALAPLLGAASGATAAAVAALVLGLAAPLLNRDAYQSNAWTLEQEQRQRLVVGAIARLADAMPAGGHTRILVTGLIFPFSPFDYGDSLGSFPALRDVRFDVMTYPPDRPHPPDARTSGRNVRFVPRQEIDVAAYDLVWAFDADGSLFTAMAPHDAAQRLGQHGMLSATDVLIYPELAHVFGPPWGPEPLPEAQAYLRCGTRFLEYQDLARARSCLVVSERLSDPNPYPYFYLGLVLERQGDLDGARRELGLAVAKQDPAQPNPAFRASLARVERALREKTSGARGGGEKPDDKIGRPP